MMTATKPLFELTADDLMSRDVVCLPLEMSMRKAASMIVQNCISGAPVVDAAGKCVGVISTHDFLAPKHPVAHGSRRPQCVCTEWEVVSTDELPLESVEKFMTADPVTVSPSASIGELAQIMVDAHIHRLVVVNSNHQPIGIVSSTDVLAALAAAKNQNVLGWQAPPAWA